MLKTWKKEKYTELVFVPMDFFQPAEFRSRAFLYSATFFLILLLGVLAP